MHTMNGFELLGYGGTVIGDREVKSCHLTPILVGVAK
jgi:hypothetical protein